MTETDNLDELIKAYSDSLMKVYEKRKPEEKEEISAIEETETEEEAPDEVPAELPQVKKDNEATDTASFMASVSTGGGAFPVPDAKVILRKDSSIVSFLVTDQNGETQKITLPAYAEKDSLSEETAKAVSYYADIFAEGFQEKRNLTVEASGGAEIILNAELTPNEEGME